MYGRNTDMSLMNGVDECFLSVVRIACLFMLHSSFFADDARGYGNEIEIFKYAC